MRGSVLPSQSARAAFGVLAISMSLYLLWRYGDAMSKGLAIRLVLPADITAEQRGTVYQTAVARG